MEADTKLIILMWFRIFYQKFKAPSSGHFRYCRLGTAGDQPGEIFDAHPRMCADPAEELSTFGPNVSKLKFLHIPVTKKIPILDFFQIQSNIESCKTQNICLQLGSTKSVCSARMKHYNMQCRGVGSIICSAQFQTGFPFR